MPKISVIIATHNRPHLLPIAISSARTAARDVEIVVVDDASSDDTAAVCKSISEITYVRVDRNQAVAGARNIGLIASSGKYITFLDDDDLRLPNSLDRQIEGRLDYSRQCRAPVCRDSRLVRFRPGGCLDHVSFLCL